MEGIVVDHWQGPDKKNGLGIGVAFYKTSIDQA